MKNIITLIALLCTLTGYGQSSYFVADVYVVGGREIVSLSADSTMAAVNRRSVPTSLSMKQYVDSCIVRCNRLTDSICNLKLAKLDTGSLLITYSQLASRGYINSVPPQSFSSLTGKPSTLSGYGITDGYPLVGNPSGFISSVPPQSFASLTGKPTTLSGYGIVDAYPLSGNPSNFLTSVPAQSFSSLTGLPTTLSGYGITDGVSISGSYSNPSWITSLSFSKISTFPGTSGQYIRGDGATATFPTSMAPSGSASGDLTGTYPSPTLVASGVSPGTYGSSTVMAALTIDSKGRITAVSTFNPKIPVTYSGILASALLGATVTPVSGATVDVLVTEK